MASETERPERQLLTYSRASSFKACPWREFIRYEVGLRPIRAAAPLRFGSLWHRCMEVLYRLQRWLDENKVELDGAEAFALLSTGYPAQFSSFGLATGHARPSFLPSVGVVPFWVAEELSKTERAWDDNTGQSVLRAVNDPAEVRGMADLATGMLRRYIARWWVLDRERWEVLDVEWAFRFPLETRSGHASSKWDVGGRIDLIVRDRSTGKVGVVEHKSCAGDPEALVEDLRVDPQADGYLYALLASGIVASQSELFGVFYRISRKKEPSVPKRNKCDGKLSDGLVVDHSACSVCKGSGVDPEPGAKGKPLKCKGKRSDGVREDHSACERCHGDELGPVSESDCDTTAEVFLAALTAANAAGFKPSDKHFAILQALTARGDDPWIWEHEKPLRSGALVAWRDGLHVLSLSKNEAQKKGETGHWRVGDKAICRAFGRSCAYMDLCERQAADTRSEWEGDMMLAQLYELAEAHEELAETVPVPGSEDETPF